MKKVAMLLTVLVLGAGVSFAGIEEDMRAAFALYGRGQYADAQAAFELVPEEYPSAPDDVLADARRMAGHSLYNQGKYVEAKDTFDSVVSAQPEAEVTTRADACRMMAHSFYRLRDFTNSQSQAEALLTDYRGAPARYLVDAHSLIGRSLWKQGLSTNADAAFFRITDYGDTPILRDVALTGGACMTRAGYIAFLEKALMVVDVPTTNNTPENAVLLDFISKIAAKLGYLRE